MTTTCMRDSRVGDEWVQRTCANNPVQRVLGPDGRPNGNILTGPVRLSFTDSIFVAKPSQKGDTTSPLKHGCTLLFPPFADMTIFWEEYNRIASAEFSKHWNGQQWVGLQEAYYNAGMKAHQYSGYTPNLYAMNVSSQIKPNVVDPRNNPIIDPAKVYPGVWAIVAVSGYASGKNFPKKGPRFGLQSIMVIADDQNLAGSAPDPRTLFGGVNVQPPAMAPAQQFGQQPPGAYGQQPMGAPPVGQAAVASYYPPQQPPGQWQAPPAQPGYPPVPFDPNDISRFM